MTPCRPERFGVLVLGMHRSGTSVATRLVNLMGFSLGPDEDLLPPRPDNPTGYWENAPLIGLNDKILQVLDGDWTRPPRLNHGWEARPEFDALRPPAAALVESALSAERWVWKDPRNCLTLPFWLTIMDSDVAIVLIYRHPLEVATSLCARDASFTVPLGLALWERYIRSALAAARGLPVWVSNYGQLMTDPEVWCRRVSDFLQTFGVDTADVDASVIRSIVRPDLRHAIVAEARLAGDPAVLSVQHDIYAALGTCLGPSDAFTPPELPPESPWVEALLDERWRTLRHRREAERAEAARREAEDRFALIASSRSYRLLGPLRALSRILDASRRRTLTLPKQPVLAKLIRSRGASRLAPYLPEALRLPIKRYLSSRLHRSHRAAVLFVSGAPGPSAHYRGDHQAEQLRLMGGTATVVRHGECDLLEALARHELVVLHRVPWGDDVAELIQRARQANKEVLFDTDDLVFDPDALKDVAVLRELPPDEVELYVQGVHRYRLTLEHCAGATVSTESLAQRIRGLGIAAVVTPNVASIAMVEAAAQWLPSHPADRERVVVGYMSGTITHRKDFAVAAKALVDVLRARPQAELRIVGPLDIDISLDGIADRVSFEPLRPWSELASVQASLDVNLAPLEPDNAFTACKSAIKWLEAALVARPTVASPRPEFRRVIRAGENGLLAESREEWLNAVASLIDSPELRERLGTRAREDALASHTTKAGAVHYVQALRTLISRTEAPLLINWILYAPIAKTGGGYRNIFRIATVLGERGHRQRMIVNPVAHLQSMNDSEITEFVDETFGIPSNAEVLVGHERIPEADVSLATYWPTAYTVAEHDRSRFKGYFIQDFEPSFHEESQREYTEAEQTYSLPLRHICLGRRLAEQIEQMSGVSSLMVDFGLDPHFTVTRPPEERGEPVQVLFFARPSLRRRAYRIGVDALAKFKRRHPESEVLFFGSSSDELGDVPFEFRNLGVIDARAVAEAMNECHVLLTFSLSNISNVPFEGMACGCAVVELDLPQVAVMTDPGNNCLLAPLEPDGIAAALSRLVDEPELRIRLGRQGAADMAGRTWERSATMFEIALREMCFLPAGMRREGKLEGVA